MVSILNLADNDLSLESGERFCPATRVMPHSTLPVIRTSHASPTSNYDNFNVSDLPRHEFNFGPNLTQKQKKMMQALPVEC